MATIEATHFGSAVGACAFAEAGATRADRRGARRVKIRLPQAGGLALRCLAPASAATTRRRGDGEAEQKAQHACKRCATPYAAACATAARRSFTALGAMTVQVSV